MHLARLFLHSPFLLNLGLTLCFAETHEGMRLIVNAQQNQQALPFYVTREFVSRLSNGVNVVATKYRWKSDNGATFGRTEISSSPAVAPHVRITNKEGTWDVYSDGAIRMPDVMLAPTTVQIENQELLASPNIQNGLSYTVSHYSEHEISYARVTVTYGPTALERLHELVGERISKANKNKENKIRLRRDDYVPARHEYVIDLQQNFIIKHISVAVSGKIISKIEYLEVRTGVELAAAMFELPRGVKLHFPATELEYNKLRSQRTSMVGANKPNSNDNKSIK